LDPGLVGLLTAVGLGPNEVAVESHRAVIVCSCNALSDQDVRSAVEAERTRSTSQVYSCLGCSAQCGRCARTIRRLMKEALGSPCGILQRPCRLSLPAHHAVPLVAEHLGEEALLRGPTDVGSAAKHQRVAPDLAVAYDAAFRKFSGVLSPLLALSCATFRAAGCERLSVERPVTTHDETAVTTRREIAVAPQPINDSYTRSAQRRVIGKTWEGLR